MATTLLATKLYVPPARQKLVSRLRLVEQVQAGLNGKLTLVSAPAGFGKSTLLSECAANCGRPVAWVSLDQGDNNPTRFLAYVLAALQRIAGGVGENLMAALQASEPPAIDGLLTTLVNELAGIEFPFILVLDDYHVISDERVHRALIFVLENQPPQMHMVISGRADPPWPLARLRARGEMTEVRVKELRFTLEEATTFLNDVMEIGLSSQDIATLELRTEGWIAGLHMAALSMRQREDASEFVRSFSASHRFILDYLVEEVLDQQPLAVQDFLLKSSVLERMSAPLCDALLEGNVVYELSSTGSEEVKQAPVAVEHTSQTVLSYLEEANLFVIPLDDERSWYRYHHLFSDLLRSRLQQLRPELVGRLHRRASQWYQRQSYVQEAIDHAIAGKDYERAAWLVEQHALQFIIESKLVTLSGWLESLPKEVTRQRPWLCVYHAWVRYWMGMRDQVAECLQSARRALEHLSLPGGVAGVKDVQRASLSEAQRRLVTGCIAAIQSYDEFTSLDLEGVIQSAQQALDLLPEEHYMSSLAALSLGEAYSTLGDHRAAIQAYQRAITIACRNDYRSLSVSITCFLGIEQARKGDLKAAYDTFQQAVSLGIGPGGDQLLAAGFPTVQAGQVAREWNDLQAANRYIRQGVDLCAQWGHPDFLTDAYIALIRLQLAQRDLEGASQTLDKANRLTEWVDPDPSTICLLDECRLRYWMWRGDLGAANHWLELGRARRPNELKYYHDLLELINQAWVLVSCGIRQSRKNYLHEAQDLVNWLLSALGDEQWFGERIKISLLQAQIQAHVDEPDRARITLLEALRLAEPGGYVRIFLEAGKPVQELLRQVVAKRIAHGYPEKLIQAFQWEEKQYREPGFSAVEAGVSQPSDGLVEPLTERELEVLLMLDTRLTSTEIAAELYISVSTVRTHIKNIYGKLDVHRRLEAVDKARQLGLL